MTATNNKAKAGKAETPSTPASPQAGAPQKDHAIDQGLSAYVADILEKQYRNYTWNDGKAYALATLDSFLFAGGFVLYDKFSQSAIASTLLFIAILCLSVSALSCCLHSIPTLRSGKAGPNDNLRALSCITGFGTWQDYQEELKKLGPDRMIEMTCRQIYGMAHNNMRSHRLLGRAARCTVAGLLLLLLAVTAAQYGEAVLSICGRGRQTTAPTNPPPLEKNNGKSRG